MHQETLSEAIEPLLVDGLIADVLYPVKSGKEGILYCCSANPRLGVELVAVKVYKPRRFRSFRDDSMYQAGRVILDRRASRAAAKWFCSCCSLFRVVPLQLPPLELAQLI